MPPKFRASPTPSKVLSGAKHNLVKAATKTDQGPRGPDTRPDFHVDHTVAGEHFHLESNREFSVVMPEKLMEYNNREGIMGLIEAYWVEHLMQEKLLISTAAPILLQYYSQRLVQMRFERAQLEVKLYGDAIANGLPLVEQADRGFTGDGESDLVQVEG